MARRFPSENKPDLMASYLVIASDITPFDGPKIRSTDVFDLMMDNNCWELTDRSPFRKEMKPGDTFVFYLGGTSGRYIAGEATIANEIEPITAKSSKTFDRSQVPFFTQRVPLTDIVRYEPKSADIDTLCKLSFVKNSPVERKYIGLLLRVGVRRLEDNDLKIIRKHAKVINNV